MCAALQGRTLAQLIGRTASRRAPWAGVAGGVGGERRRGVDALVRHRRLATSAAAQELSSPADSGSRGSQRRLPQRGDIARILALARPEAATIAGGMAFVLVGAGVNLAIPAFMGRVIDFATTMDVAALGLAPQHLPLVLGAGLSAGAVAAFGRIYLLKMATERIVTRLRQRLFGAVLANEIAFFDQTRTGELVNRLSNDVNLVGRSVTNNIADGVRTVIQSAAGVCLMAWISPKLTLVMLSIVPPVALGAMFYGRWVRDIFKRTQDALAETTKVAEERLSSMRTVRAFAQEDTELQRYSDRVQDVLKLAMREALASGTFFASLSLLGNVSVCAMLYVGGQLVMTHAITVGELSSFMLYTLYVGGSIAGLSSFYTELMRGVGASKRVFELLERRPAIALSGGLRPAKVRGHVRFEGVRFSYPARSDVAVFDGLSLEAMPGTVTAIVGESGSGKSTIGALLLRFYDPAAGRVVLDDVDVRELDPSWLREHVGLVSQEPTLFAGTILDNIAYGTSGASLERVREVAAQANAASFIELFPDKYNTFCGERGVSLSGGQKQRIAIARALLKNPQILVLDEATSALDAESEHAVQDALDRLMTGRTVITIAHRLSTIMTADKVVHIGQGRVLEQGTYDELIDLPNGQFRRLVQKQLSDARGDV